MLTRLAFRFIPHPYEFIKKPKKFMHAMVDKLPNNIIIKHVDRQIRGKTDIGNLLYNADFTAA